MEYPFDFYLPVRDATIFCHSKLLDDIGDFTKFVIWNLGMKKEYEDINQVIQLSPDILSEELDYLKEHGLSTGSNESGWELTSLGQEYFALLQCINTMEKEGIPAYLNMISGIVIPCTKDMTVVSESVLPADAMKVGRDAVVSDVFFRNDNYGNSLDFALQFLEKNELLEKQHMSSLYTTMRVSKDNRLYAKCHVDVYSYEVPSEKTGLKIAVPVAVTTFKKFYDWLEEYRAVLDTLTRLRQYGNDLLSDKAIQIETVYQQECAEPDVVYCFDRFARQLIREPLNVENLINAEAVKDHLCIHLPSHETNFHLKAKGITLKPVSTDTGRVAICGVTYRFT